MAKILALVHKAANATGRSVIMIHYAGHGSASDSNELILSSASGKKIGAVRFIDTILTDSMTSFDAAVDIILIFDCCFSFLATRNPAAKARMVEILTADDDRDPIAFSAGKRLSFTSKLLIETRKRAQNGDKFIEIAELIDSLKKSSPVKTPGYGAKLGMGSITLALMSPSSSGSSPASSRHFLSTCIRHSLAMN